MECWLYAEQVTAVSMQIERPGLVVPTARGGDAASFGLDDRVYERLLKERIIFLGTEVRDEMANAICAQMLLLAAEDPDRDIYLYINSPGGSVSAGMAIYDTMQYVKNDIATFAMGLAASMGHPGDPWREDVQAAVERVRETCRRHRMPFGTVPRDRADLARQIERGCQLITVATLEWGIQATHDAVAELSKLTPRVG